MSVSVRLVSIDFPDDTIIRHFNATTPIGQAIESKYHYTRNQQSPLFDLYLEDFVHMSFPCHSQQEHKVRWLKWPVAMLMLSLLISVSFFCENLKYYSATFAAEEGLASTPPTIS